MNITAPNTNVIALDGYPYSVLNIVALLDNHPDVPAQHIEIRNSVHDLNNKPLPAIHCDYLSLDGSPVTDYEQVITFIATNFGYQSTGGGGGGSDLQTVLDAGNTAVDTSINIQGSDITDSAFIEPTVIKLEDDYSTVAAIIDEAIVVGLETLRRGGIILRSRDKTITHKIWGEYGGSDTAPYHVFQQKSGTILQTNNLCIIQIKLVSGQFSITDSTPGLTGTMLGTSRAIVCLNNHDGTYSSTVMYSVTESYGGTPAAMTIYVKALNSSGSVVTTDTSYLNVLIYI